MVSNNNFFHRGDRGLRPIGGAYAPVGDRREKIKNERKLAKDAH